ncbi:MAG TPA: MarR family transcriptional regulator [Pedococcus sp.]|nr:MarR family transcriptional regulator [Pedococcus sp.]
MSKDAVERMTRQWRRERPDIDPESMALFARLSRAQASAGEAIEATLARFGINRGEFDVLASLRRSGEPFELSAGALAAAVVLSPSAMTNRLKRLEEHGLVTRRPDPGNGRVVLVALTSSGRGLVDKAVVAHVATLDGLLSGFSAREVRAMSGLLARLESATS